MTILDLHKFVFNLMEDIRYQLDKKYSPNSFCYGLRQQGNEKKPFKDYIFQGSEKKELYVYLSGKPAKNNITNTVYVHITTDLESKIVIVYDNVDKNKAIYDRIANSLGILTNISKHKLKTSYSKQITPPRTTEVTFKKDLTNYLDTNFNLLIAALVRAGLEYNSTKFDNSISKLFRSGVIVINTAHSSTTPPYYYQINTTNSQNTGTIQNTNKHQGNQPINNDKMPLNLILYGPPGTGKTYNTVNKALEIILGKSDYDKLKEKADEAKSQISDSKEANKAYRKVFTDKFNELKNDGRIVFTTFHQSMSYEDFIEGIKPDSSANKTRVTYPIKNGIFKQFCYDIIKKYLMKRNIIVENEKEEKKIKEKIQEVITSNNFCDNDKETLDEYVFIIDEINRGNVSQIFGELITLIEDDKRLGEPEAKAYTVTLPYSNEEFSVPKNLYIIGTMNTADRSVEALDTALRRRFSFEEMMPKQKLLTGKIITIGNTQPISLEEILDTINKRLLVLKDREHQIGHSYFMGVTNGNCLKKVFFDKIIPLLQEYFYGDYEKIQMVLGEGFVKTTETKDFVSFATKVEPDTLPKEIYSIEDKDSMDELTFEKALNLLLNADKPRENDINGDV